MNVSLTGIPLGEWRDLTDDELIDLFKLIENSSSEAKPKARPKAKAATPGIKRPVVKMENSNDRAARLVTGNVSPSRDVKERALTPAAGRRIRRPGKGRFLIRFISLLFSHTGGLSSLPLHAAPSAYRYIPFHAVRFRIAQRAAMRNTRAVKQRFSDLALFALGHLFCVIRGVPWWCPQSDQSTQCTAMNILLIACMATKAGTRPVPAPGRIKLSACRLFGDGLS